MWVGLGLLKEKEACQPGVAGAKRRRLLSQVLATARVGVCALVVVVLAVVILCNKAKTVIPGLIYFG